MRYMRATTADYSWDKANKAKYYRRVDIVNAVDELKIREFAIGKNIIANVEHYRLARHLSLYALNES